MKVNQVYETLNSLTEQITGQSDLVQTDLSNVVDIGKTLFDNSSVDNYVKKLVDHIGKVAVVNRQISSMAPSLVMDSWEFGAALEKITIAPPEASTNPTWSLTDGQTYNQDEFYAPEVTAKFYSERNTYSIPISRAERQVVGSFSNATQLSAFFSGIETAIRNAVTINTDAMIRATIGTMIGKTLANEASNGTYTGRTGVKAVNLLYEYNTAHQTTLTAAEAMQEPEFIRYASNRMQNYISWMTGQSSLFNVGGTLKFTPREDLHVILLSEFKNAANTYLQSNTFNEEYTALPLGETVQYWQGSGETFDFSDTSSLNIQISDGTSSGKTTINATGILGVMADRWAMGVNNQNFRSPTHVNASGEFVNIFYKYDGSFFVDDNENFVVFYAA